MSDEDQTDYHQAELERRRASLPKRPEFKRVGASPAIPIDNAAWAARIERRERERLAEAKSNRAKQDALRDAIRGAKESRAPHEFRGELERLGHPHVDGFLAALEAKRTAQPSKSTRKDDL